VELEKLVNWPLLLLQRVLCFNHILNYFSNWIIDSLVNKWFLINWGIF
jgi:hypothetical protein